MDNLRDLYQQTILDHAMHPRNFNKLDETASCANGFNPLCGDKLRLCVSLDNEHINTIRFSGDGCAISKASASLLTELLKGKTTTEALTLFEKFHAMIVNKQPADASLGKLTVLQGVQEFPTRIKCATLAWHTFRTALQGEVETTTE